MPLLEKNGSFIGLVEFLLYYLSSHMIKFRLISYYFSFTKYYKHTIFYDAIILHTFS